MPMTHSYSGYVPRGCFILRAPKARLAVNTKPTSLVKINAGVVVHGRAGLGGPKDEAPGRFTPPVRAGPGTSTVGMVLPPDHTGNGAAAFTLPATAPPPFVER